MKSNYYFVKPYDDSQALPPHESFGQILKEAYLYPFRWEGRTTRKSFWISALINFILSIVAYVLYMYAFANPDNMGIIWGSGVIATIVAVWIFLSMLGQTIRRLHDVDYSGYWYWAGLISNFVFYLSIQPSAQKPVKWGNYLYLDGNDGEKDAYYNKEYDPAMDVDDTPVPTIPQILKEHFFKCFTWNARSTRTSYWAGTFVSGVIGFIGITIYYATIFLISTLTMLAMVNPSAGEWIGAFITSFGIFITIYLLLALWVFLAQLAHAVRRLHDAGISGWWWLLNFIPVIGQLLVSFMLFHPTYKGEIKWNGYLFDDKERIR